MPIVRNIKDLSDGIRKNWCTTGKDDAVRLQNMAIAAMVKGMNKPDGTVTDEWRDYMNNFTTEPRELARLRGEDPDYLSKEWGLPSLAYIVANGMCTEFSFANTTRNMDDDMLNGLDDFTLPEDGEDVQPDEESDE